MGTEAGSLDDETKLNNIRTIEFYNKNAKRSINTESKLKSKRVTNLASIKTLLANTYSVS